MSPTPRKTNRIPNRRPSRPIQDITMARRSTGQFPDVGMTLSSYQGSGTGRLKPVPAPRKPGMVRRFFRGISLKRAFITLLLAVLVVGGYLGGKFLYELHKAFGGSIFGLFETTHLKGEDTGRVNILLTGYSVGDPHHQGAALVDSIMIVSLDVKNNTGWILSIPRDMWTRIPNHGYQKINAVYEDGQADNFSAPGYPNGGMGDLEQIVSREFGVPIDYYALINYAAFKDAVNAVGGIRVDIQSPDPRGLYDAYTHLKLPNGWVTLDGQQALDLARARGDNSAGDISYGFPNSDFDRTMHQRQMLEALKSKATSTGVLANPITLANLFNAIGKNVKTDLTIADVRRLYDLSKKIPTSKIQSLSIQDLLTGYYAPDGEDALIPKAGFGDYSQIQQFVAQHMQN